MRINFSEMFQHNQSKAARDLNEFIQGTASLNTLRRRWPSNVRSVVYKMERVGVDRARRSAYGALRSRGFVTV